MSQTHSIRVKSQGFFYLRGENKHVLSLLRPRNSVNQPWFQSLTDSSWPKFDLQPHHRARGEGRGLGQLSHPHAVRWSEALHAQRGCPRVTCLVIHSAPEWP